MPRRRARRAAHRQPRRVAQSRRRRGTTRGRLVHRPDARARVSQSKRSVRVRTLNSLPFILDYPITTALLTIHVPTIGQVPRVDPPGRRAQAR